MISSGLRAASMAMTGKPFTAGEGSMAKLFAGEQKPVTMKLWLTKASERGFDVRAGMKDSAVFKPWLKDPEIQMMLQNSARMRKGTVAMVTPLPDTPMPNKVN